MCNRVAQRGKIANKNDDYRAVLLIGRYLQRARTVGKTFRKNTIIMNELRQTPVTMPKKT